MCNELSSCTSDHGNLTHGGSIQVLIADIRDPDARERYAREDVSRMECVSLAARPMSGFKPLPGYRLAAAPAPRTMTQHEMQALRSAVTATVLDEATRLSASTGGKISVKGAVGIVTNMIAAQADPDSNDPPRHPATGRFVPPGEFPVHGQLPSSKTPAEGDDLGTMLDPDERAAAAAAFAKKFQTASQAYSKDPSKSWSQHKSEAGL